MMPGPTNVNFLWILLFFFQIARAALWHSRARIHAVYAPSQRPCKLRISQLWRPMLIHG